ncbi:DUF3883 domain-containing protein [Variovorax sp. J22G73]|uniref:DUF3883 domain-containing protein n=1 Tax=unclassified Variovorax TaxID=663243 RepID=UPI002578AEDD|nr:MULTISPECIES: DUF3883 domain-containing protein [unclassified Variovorax]MDM0007462.1 DUF3883 domain-containing protein [Variovorax sp. J22R203]MDM0100178.1 DUF3883 domain-containing protein [Variovorax sp. J22G73]
MAATFRRGGLASAEPAAIGVPNESTQTAVARLKTSYATGGFDYDAAEAMVAMLGAAKGTGASAYQLLIELEANNGPTWLAALPRGRQALRDALTVDAGECFRRSGAFDTPPSLEIVGFLDRLASTARAHASLPLVESGRLAERMSFELEVARCAEMQGAPAVEWIALDDNSAGYDILSSRMVDGRPYRKLIEVKSCRGKPLRMIVTRNEWNTACQQPDGFVFHFWDMIASQLHELSWGDLEPHMPRDQGTGRWDSATLILAWLHGN